MSNPAPSVYDDIILTDEAFEVFCNDSLYLLADELDETNQNVLKNRYNISRNQQSIYDNYVEIVRLEDNIVSLRGQMAQFQRSAIRAAIFSAALGAAIITGIAVCKRR